MEELSMETKLLLKQKLLDNSFIILENLNKNLNQDLKKFITQSTVDLLSCYFCLQKVEDPLLCPKCNNFACKRCLTTYFGGEQTKKCGICKQLINFSDLKENKVLKELKNIVSLDKTQKNVVDEFYNVIKEKQRFYFEQKKEISDIINGFNNYKLCLEKYKTGFINYLLECQQLVEKTFNKYYKNIENLLKSLLSYDNIYQKSIDKYNEIYNKVKENYFNSENIKEFINEILYLEKKQLNANNKLETKNFLLAPITFKPYFKNYSVMAFQNLNKSSNYELYEFESLNLGKCTFKIDYSQNNKIYTCKLKANTTESICEKCFFLRFCKKGDSARDFIMKIIKKEGLKYYFGCEIVEKNLFMPDENSIQFNIDCLEMDTFNR